MTLMPLVVSATLASVPVRILREPRTGSRIVLVGVMHHNPASLDLARSTVQHERQQKRLRTLLVESCTTRWNATLAQPGWLKCILADEMVGAANAAEEGGGGRAVKLSLADQRIQRTVRRARVLAEVTLWDLATPWNGGWWRVLVDLRDGVRCLTAYEGDGADLTAGSAAADGGANYSSNSESAIGLCELLDPRLVCGMPLASARYIFSLLIRGPVAFRGIAALSVALSVLGSTGALQCDPSTPPESWRWCVAALDGVATSGVAASGGGVDVSSARLDVLDLSPLINAISAVAAVVAGRVGLTAGLEERNYYLAKSIRRECLRAWWKGESGADVSVVAVMGLAHVNGVRQLLAGVADIEIVADLVDGRYGRARELDGRARRARRGEELDFDWNDS